MYTGFATFGANPSNPQDIVEDRLQFVDKLSMDFGAHRPSVGTDISRIAKTGVFNANAVGVYTFNAGAAYPFNPNNPASFPARFEQGFSRSAPADLAAPRLRSVRFRRHRPARTWNLSFFAQDDWQVSARADPQSGAALREANVQPRRQQHHVRAPASPGTWSGTAARWFAADTAGFTINCSTTSRTSRTSSASSATTRSP